MNNSNNGKNYMYGPLSDPIEDYYYKTHLIKPLTTSALESQIGGSHYKKYKIQPVEYAMANNLDYCSANAIKYITRHRDKGGIEDLRKAIHNLEILIELESKAQ